MLQGKNLLRRRKNIRIKKRRNWKVLYFLIGSLFVSILLLFAGYYLNLYYPDILSPLARERFYGTLKIEQALTKANIKFIKVARQNKDLSFEVILSEQEEVIFSSKKDIQSQIASLQLITKRLTIEGKRFKSLDFRYDKPLIVF
jgi:hypothetical protein